MYQRALTVSGGGGGGKESLIFYDWSNGGYGGFLADYDPDAFEIVSGAFRATAAGASNITVKAKKAMSCTLFFENGSSNNATFSVNGTNIATSTPLKQTFTLNSGDTVTWNSPLYYGSCVVTGA